MTSSRHIELVRAGSGELAPDLLPWLADRLRGVFQAKVEVGRDLGPIGPYVPDGAPRDANQLLDEAIDSGRVDGRGNGWLLALTADDLTAAPRPFVFGVATVGGSWALVSVARFGIPAAPSPRLRERALKESIHELGHLAGLGHCADPECAMGLATRISEIDRKKSDFCEKCALFVRRSDRS